MKMIKRTLIAIAVVALLATSAHAALSEWYLDFGDSAAVKVEGTDKPTFRWPYSFSYKALTICNIPIKMDIGMYVQVKDCNKKKIVLVQVDCADIEKQTKDYPCYKGCVDFDVRSKFEVKLGTKLHKVGDVIDKCSDAYEGTDVVPGDGSDHNIKLCVTAWKARIYKHQAQDQVDVGNVDITVKPNT
jgi:hypothetical protein